jgi:hypothetical protein
MVLDIESLEDILENDNHTILNKTYSKIKDDKNNILQKLNLSREKLKDLNSKLKNYRYIDELSDIVFGNFCRWIKLDTLEPKLEKGGFLSCITISETGPLLCIKTFRGHLSINANNILIFQKINDQEQVLLKVMKYIEK